MKHGYIITAHVQADQNNHLIRKIIVATGAVSTLAGTVGTAGHADGVGTLATFYLPFGVALDFTGSIALVVSACWSFHSHISTWR